jgi:putative ABC transport system permease protein
MSEHGAGKAQRHENTTRSGEHQMGVISSTRARPRLGRTFYLTYLRRELQHRRRQALLAAAGLAVGVGLVVTVTAATAGVSDAEAAVLHSLYGVGTDVSVTKAAPNPGTPNPGNPSTSGSPRKGIGYSPGKNPQPVDQLSPAPGLSWLPASAVAQAARLHKVRAAAGGLTLTDTQFTVPSLAQLGPNGQPPASAFPATFTVDGVDLTRQGLGPFASARLVSGHGFAASDASADVAVVDSGYAAAHKLKVGSAITIEFRRFTVIGIISQPPASAADVYIPLARAQALAKSSPASPYFGMTSRDMVTNIYVAAASASDVPAVQAELARLLPSATVSSSADLASQVSGSLNSAATLAADLGRWLAVGVLIAAFAVASLLTLAAVARRYRELGTLKALGWPGRRVIAQIMGESLVTGVTGAVLGVALGLGGAAIVAAAAPRLSATVAQSPGSTPPQDVGFNGAGAHRSYPAGSFHTVAVHMGAPVTVAAIVLAIMLALAGALIAGLLGSWRVSRLQPAAAMSAVE